jgi:spore coat protein CotH
VPNNPSEPDYIVEDITPTGNENFMTLKSDYIFDQDKLPTFNLYLPSASLAQIDADPTAEEYVEATLKFEGETISPIGVRYKGSIGAFVECLSGTDWANPSGYKTCTKLSMKFKINWEGRDTKFYGLKKIQLHSQNLDDSQLHDRLGYYLFREMGVPAPRAIHARLMINDQYVGLFSLVEQIDGRFVKQNFSDDDGNLYKEVWPIDENGHPQSDQTYLNALKTNEEDNPTANIIRNFAQEIANADSIGLRSVIENRMYLNKIISYAVVDRMIRNDDGAFHWYCDGGGCSNHNFYWYEEPNNNKLHLIPWDLDNAFENIVANSNPVTPIADQWGEKRNNCQPFPYGWFQMQQRSAACDKLTGGWASYQTEYQTIKTQFKNGVFAEAHVNNLIDTWAAQIRDATIEAANAHTDAISLSDWEAAVQLLKNQLQYARSQ